MSAGRQTIGPLFLFACIVLGGSAQGILSNLALQLAGLAILCWAALTRTPDNASRAARFLGWIGALGVAIVVVQLVPLPPAIWTHLPGRQVVVAGLALLGQSPGWMPLSLAPAHTISTAMALIPPLAMIALILRLGAYRIDWLIVAVLLATCMSVGFGVLQIRGDGQQHYFYAYNSWGTASGLFANANHMATLLLVSIPLLVAISAQRWRGRPKPNDRFVTAVVAGAVALVLLTGIVVNQSFALLLIGGPVVGASALLLIPASRVRLGRLAGVLAVLLVIGTGALAVDVAAGMSTANKTSVAMRADIWDHSLRVLGNYGLAGSGVGTFPEIYPMYENPVTIERTYINHAHNDYLEMAIETGVLGVLLMIAFLIWWGWRSIAIWRSADVGEISRAATIATAAVLLHSLVDYPLRTAAIACCFAMAVALMADPARRRVKQRLGDLRPTRHLSL